MPKRPEQESFYEIHLNKQNEVMISLHAREEEPSSPVLLYDGGEHALLYRTPQSTVLLDFIHPDARQALFNAPSALIAETKNFKVVREYIAVCRQVKSLPLDGSGIKPLLDADTAKTIDERHLYE